MSTQAARPIPAFLASDVAGNVAAVILSTFAGETPEQMLAHETDALTVLDRVVRSTRYTEFRSFTVQRQSMEFIEARVKHVMAKAYEQDNTILLVRADSAASRDAFYRTLKHHYEVQPIVLPQQVAA